VHKIVALIELKHSMINEFFQNLTRFASTEAKKLNNTNNKFKYDRTRQNVQSRLTFLSFVFSTMGSPRDFELSAQNVGFSSPI
jgi:hypothetical protein